MNRNDNQWTIVDEDGGAAIAFTTFISLSLTNEGSALTYPVEKGSFASYNKVESPLSITAVFASQGSDADFGYILDTLDDYKRNAVTLSVSTPSRFYESMTLKSYSYERSRESGAGLLSVSLNLVEVREVESQITTTISKAQNPTSANTQNTGKRQSREATRAENAAAQNPAGSAPAAA